MSKTPFFSIVGCGTLLVHSQSWCSAITSSHQGMDNGEGHVAPVLCRWAVLGVLYLPSLLLRIDETVGSQGALAGQGAVTDQNFLLAGSGCGLRTGVISMGFKRLTLAFYEPRPFWIMGFFSVSCNFFYENKLILTKFFCSKWGSLELINDCTGLTNLSR